MYIISTKSFAFNHSSVHAIFGNAQQKKKFKKLKISVTFFKK